MSETASNVATMKTRHCPVCHEAIHKEASKCKHCQSSISPVWRWLHESHVVLALLVALTSVLVAGLPPVMWALRPDEDRVQAYLLEVRPDENRVDLSLTNVGTRPATVQATWISPIPENAVREGRLKWLLSGPVDRVIQPGNTYALRLAAKDRIPRQVDALDPGEPYHIVIVVRRFDGEEQTLRLPFRGRM